MKTFLLFMAVFIYDLLLAGCEKEKHLEINGNIMPAKLNFVLLDKGGNSLLTSTSTPLKVASKTTAGRYFELGSECDGGGCTMINLFPAGAHRPYDFFYASLDAPWASINGSKEWYLTLNGKTDTLYYDVQRTRPNDPLDQFDVVGISFNGEPIKRDETLGPPAYVLQRRH